MPTTIEPQPTSEAEPRSSRFRQPTARRAPPGTTGPAPADRHRRQQDDGARQREADRDPLGPVLEGVDGVGEADVHGQEGDVGDQRTTRPRAAGRTTSGHRAADVAWISPPGFGRSPARGLGRRRGFSFLRRSAADFLSSASLETIS